MMGRLKAAKTDGEIQDAFTEEQLAALRLELDLNALDVPCPPVFKEVNSQMKLVLPSEPAPRSVV
jgi:hypothetical protein